MPANILPIGYASQSHGQSSYSSDDLPKAVVMTLNPGSAVKSMDFHPVQQILLLVGTSAGEIMIWELGSKERLSHRSFKVWDLAQCSVALQKQIRIWDNVNEIIKGTVAVENAFGVYTPCVTDSLVISISHLVILVLCLYRIWKIKTGITPYEVSASYSLICYLSRITGRKTHYKCGISALYALCFS